MKQRDAAPKIIAITAVLRLIQSLLLIFYHLLYKCGGKLGRHRAESSGRQ
jgi:hypothetical protein